MRQSLAPPRTAPPPHASPPATDGVHDAKPDLKVVFLGKSVQGLAGTLDSAQYIARRAEAWWPGLRRNVRILTDFDATAALEYIRRLDTPLVVLPSLAENSPYVVAECLYSHLPFIAARTGGTEELVHDDDKARVLFQPTLAALVSRIRHALTTAVRPARPIGNTVGLGDTWLAILRERRLSDVKNDSVQTDEPDTSRGTQSGPAGGVTICIPTRNRPGLLDQSVRSALAQQTQESVNVLIVDDSSDDAEALAGLRKWELSTPAENSKHSTATTATTGMSRLRVRRTTRQLGDGAARNECVRWATTPFIVFLDDDNVAKPEMVQSLLTAAQTARWDIVTCLLDEFASLEEPQVGEQPTSRWVPVGPAIAAGLHRNVFGDTAMLVRREPFLALGGFSEQPGVGFTDWEFLARAALSGRVSMGLVPRGLLWYRNVQPLVATRIRGSTSAAANHLRVAQAFQAGLPSGLCPLLVHAAATTRRENEDAMARNDIMRDDGLTSLADSARDFACSQGAQGWTYGFRRVVGSTVGVFVPLVSCNMTRQGWQGSNRTPQCPQHLHHHRHGAHPVVRSCHASFSLHCMIAQHLHTSPPPKRSSTRASQSQIHSQIFP